jgi:hypothetical protein
LAFVPGLLLVPVVPLLLLLLHAAIETAAAANAAAMTAGFLEPRMGSHLLMMPGFLLLADAADALREWRPCDKLRKFR